MHDHQTIKKLVWWAVFGEGWFVCEYKKTFLEHRVSKAGVACWAGWSLVRGSATTLKTSLNLRNHIPVLHLLCSTHFRDAVAVSRESGKHDYSSCPAWGVMYHLCAAWTDNEATSIWNSIEWFEKIQFMVLDYKWWWICLRFNDDSNRICRNLGKWGAVVKPRIKISLALVHLKSVILMSVFGDSRPCGSRRGKSGEFCPEGSVLDSRQICHSLHHLLPLPCQPTNSTGRSWPHMRRHTKWKETEKKKGGKVFAPWWKNTHNYLATMTLKL